jgi:hypothetical protein
MHGGLCEGLGGGAPILPRQSRASPNYPDHLPYMPCSLPLTPCSRNSQFRAAAFHPHQSTHTRLAAAESPESSQILKASSLLVRSQQHRRRSQTLCADIDAKLRRFNERGGDLISRNMTGSASPFTGAQIFETSLPMRDSPRGDHFQSILSRATSENGAAANNISSRTGLTTSRLSQPLNVVPESGNPSPSAG